MNILGMAASAFGITADNLGEKIVTGGIATLRQQGIEPGDMYEQVKKVVSTFEEMNERLKRVELMLSADQSIRQ